MVCVVLLFVRLAARSTDSLSRLPLSVPTPEVKTKLTLLAYVVYMSSLKVRSMEYGGLPPAH